MDCGRLRTLEALRINGSTPESKSCIAFCMVASASRELNLGSDILICTINFQFGCNLAGEEEERVQTRVARLGGWLASWGATLSSVCGDEGRKPAKNGTDSRKHSWMSCGLAERSRLVWLQPDWTGWRERGYVGGC